MNRIDKDNIFSLLFKTALKSGEVALSMQKTIVNEKKPVDEIENERSCHKAMREAKTKADEIVQEMFLNALLPYKDILTLDVEEDTCSTSLYNLKNYECTFILDPIDGTLRYIQQEDGWSICAGIIKENTFLCALVYFPKGKIMYVCEKDKGAYVYHNPKHIDDRKRLVFPSMINKDKIYYNYRLATSFVSYLQENGFEMIEDTKNQIGCPDAIIECINAKACAYIGAGRNLRDILLAVIFSFMQQGKALDFQGNPIVWETHGRQKELVITINAYLMQVLSKYKK